MPPCKGNQDLSQQGRADQECHCPYIQTVPRSCFYPGWISISLNMYFSALILLLVSSLSVTAALPVPGTVRNDENDHSVNTPSGWGFFSKTSIWAMSHDGSRGPLDHNPEPGHLETINIPPAIDNPCHHKGPLQCPPLTPNPVASIPHCSNCAKQSNRFPASQGTFDSLWNVERILTPVGILAVMVWLGFVAFGIVAAVDYAWVRWGRGYNGYPGVDVEVGDDEEKAETN
ncbi:uncharacterized protein ASPGLDRAFT_791322 [Aspergillus glaucus CBS 516.65]|uniref:Uncharacterized protein n=1 Tax=Aspergillus glaucus CBS 516.65 TaxID=1160497 RepID=A0A1L9VA86_ASPGL|nr:hypothetical protein ASPGLDRAFT_791322 [Aspergillus glaucus CBS 516.65]OJJ80838.1 hypothetical protein ASPGLDRAFT_791322 [Aspergillus glaucus CBS 516.65]